MRFRVLIGIAIGSVVFSSSVFAQRSVRKPRRAAPPSFQPNEFSGIFYSDALSQLQGEMPTAQSVLASNAMPDNAIGRDTGGEGVSNATGNAVWKELVSPTTIEDIIKESKTRLDAVVTTPAKFSGAVGEARREFTLLATTMAVVSQYPEEIRWQSSATYAQRIFARMADNCKVGTPAVFNEAKLRQQDLQNMLKGSKLTGTADEVSWEGTADRGPTMQLLEWALRKNLIISTNNEKSFRESQEDIVKYAELIAMLGNVIQQPGMKDADADEYKQFSVAMTQAANDATKASKANDPELARTAVSRIEQACNKCHETYR
jgi:hypothetical protein